MKKVILNKCFGGFGLSKEAYELYAKKKGISVFHYTQENLKKEIYTYATDDNRTFDFYFTEYNAGLISKAEYFRLTDNLDDKTAIKFVEQMNKEIQDETISDGSEFDLRE